MNQTANSPPPTLGCIPDDLLAATGRSVDQLTALNKAMTKLGSTLRTAANR